MISEKCSNSGAYDRFETTVLSFFQQLKYAKNIYNYNIINNAHPLRDHNT